MLDSITSELVGVSSRDFFPSTSRDAVVIKLAQYIQCPPPKICDGKKSSKIFRNFWQLSTLIANISGKDQHIKNQKSSWSSTTPPTLDEKKMVYFGPQTKKLLTLINLHPNGFFSRDYISALRGVLRSEIFTHARDWTRLTTAHPKGDGGPPPLPVPKKSWKLKIWLKIQRARVHKFRDCGSIRTKLIHATCH